MGLRDMFSAISGLEANSTWLDVIGNNISNTNTVAYKASRVEFEDALSQTLYSGQGDNTGSNIGGVNPEQVGLGTRVASITTLWTEGAIQQTGLSTDVAINGNGFLMSKNAGTTYLTRAGNLTFDSVGNLVDQNGGLIQGWSASTDYKTTILDSRNLTGVGNTVITSAQLVLDNSNPSNIGNIQIKQGFVEPAKATTELNFVGNLDSFQQATNPGGITNLGTAGAPLLPFNDVPFIGFNPAKANLIPYPPGNLGVTMAVQQLANLSTPVDPLNTANPDATTPVVTVPITLADVQAHGGNYAWDQNPPIPPALTTTATVYDSTGTPRQLTTLFYQVNDLGTAVPPINNAAGPNQAMYAWYSFDTTNGAKVSDATLVGGTGIVEGYIGGIPTPIGAVPPAPNPPAVPGYNKGTVGDEYWGDFVWFNTDGSLGSMGGVHGIAAEGAEVQCQATIYLPPINEGPAPVSPIPTIGAEITAVTMNFGTAGAENIANGTSIFYGKRDGLTGDAEGSYQVVNGVNTYVPDSHSTETQNGYADGVLQSVAFDATGTINGTFSNGQTTALAQVAMANVENEGGLDKVGNDYYTSSTNAGREIVGTAGTNGLGIIQGGSLEASNVDLTTELSNMIIAQRGFDVNSRVIAVENANLQVLTQLGQGG